MENGKGDGRNTKLKRENNVVSTNRHVLEDLYISGKLTSGIIHNKNAPRSKKRSKPAIKKNDVSVLFENVNDTEAEDRYLKSLDPKEWRKQDHYAVLGLKDLRFEATESQIKQAYRKRVLKHHPDKRPPEEHTNKDSDYFTCITRAWEVLGSKTSRRAYDSVDPYFDDSLPSNGSFSGNSFYRVLGEVFKRNERWSEVTSVPELGDENSAREDVERFYNFWFNFRSWRDFSYDFEEPDTSMDRDERRWIEKQNKANRQKQKKEEMSRIRKLVEMAYNNDPRLIKFKNEDKERKLAAKRAKEEEIRANKLREAQRIKEAEEKERKAKEEEMAKKQKEQDALKAEQDQIRKSVKKLKKNIRDLCKQNNYFTENGDNTVEHMTLLERSFDAVSLDDLRTFYRNLSNDGRKSFLDKIAEVKRKIKEERLHIITGGSAARKQNGEMAAASATSAEDSCTNGGGNTLWSNKELQLLIKAVGMFPAGTNQRWEVIANFLSQHSGETNAVRSPNEVLIKVKEMQKVNHQDSTTKENKTILQSNTFTDLTRIWTNTEQKLLEQALKTYTANTADRWDKIAACVPTRTKEEVIGRYKELVEAIKAKRAAVQTAK